MDQDKKKKILILLGLFISMITLFVVLFLIFQSEPVQQLQTSNPLASNIQKASLSKEGKLRFFTGSNFAEYDPITNQTTSLTPVFVLPNILSVQWSEDFAIFESTNHKAGDILFKALFNSPEHIDKILDSHWWLVDFKSGEISFLPSVEYGRVSGAASYKSTVVYSVIEPVASVDGGEADGEQTVFYEVSSPEDITQIGSVQESFNIVSLSKSSALLFSFGQYYWLDLSSDSQPILLSGIELLPTLLPDGSLVSVLSDQEANGGEGDNKEDGHGGEASLSKIIHISTPSLEQTEIGEGAASLLLLGDLVVIPFSTSEDGRTIQAINPLTSTTNRYELLGAPSEALVSVFVINVPKEDGSLETLDFLFTTGSGKLYRASSNQINLGLDNTNQPVIKRCNEQYCIENVATNTYLITVTSNPFSVGQSAALEDLINGGIDINQIKLRWLDLSYRR